MLTRHMLAELLLAMEKDEGVLTVFNRNHMMLAAVKSNKATRYLRWEESDGPGWCERTWEEVW